MPMKNTYFKRQVSNISFYETFLRKNCKGAKYEVTETGEYDIDLRVDGSFNTTWLPIFLRKNNEIIKELQLYKKDFRMSSPFHVYLGKLHIFENCNF